MRSRNSRKSGAAKPLMGTPCEIIVLQTKTSLPGSLYGSGCRSTELTTEKIALWAPMASASVNTATTVKPGFFHSLRAAKRMSRQHVSRKDSQPAVRTTSLVTSRLPRSRRTARSASWRLKPWFIFSSAAISRKPCSSSSSSWPARSFPNSDRNPSARFRRSDMVLTTPPRFSRWPPLVFPIPAFHYLTAFALALSGRNTWRAYCSRWLSIRP